MSGPRTDLAELRQRYAEASAEFAARARKLSEGVGSLEVDAFMKLWEKCNDAHRLCQELSTQIRSHGHLVPTLTTREEEILKLVAEGMSNKEIATALNVSVKTIEFHKSQIYKRLSLNGNVALARYAIKIGLVAP